MKRIFSNFGRYKANRGSALANVVVISAVVGVMGYMMNLRLGNEMKMTKRDQIANYRDQVGRIISGKLRDVYSVQTSFAAGQGNNALRRCVTENPLGTKDCSACTMAGLRAATTSNAPGSCWRNMRLMTDETGAPSDNVLTDDVRVAGVFPGMSQGFPYSTTGEPNCSTSDTATCPFRTIVQFAPVCPRVQNAALNMVEQTTCDRADLIYFRYRIYDAGSSTGVNLGQYPPAVEFQDFNLAIRMPVSKLVGSDDCPAGAIAYGHASGQMGYAAPGQFRGTISSEKTKGAVACKCEWESTALMTEAGRNLLRRQLTFNERGQPTNCTEIYTLALTNANRGEFQTCPSGTHFGPSYRAANTMMYGYEFGTRSGIRTRIPDCKPRACIQSTRFSSSGTGDGMVNCRSRTNGDYTSRLNYVRASGCVINSGNITCSAATSGCCYRLGFR